ncbi:MAG: hypothetical protein R2729_19845 [Bryobacteraceae bacterium]
MAIFAAAAALCLLASTDAAGYFFYGSARTIWRQALRGDASSELLFALQKMFHVAIFGTFGAVSGAGWESAAGRRWYWLGIGVCLAAEAVQRLTASRSPSWMDGALNVACFTGATAIAQIWRARQRNA